jgi:hypothetical protein
MNRCHLFPLRCAKLLPFLIVRSYLFEPASPSTSNNISTQAKLSSWMPERSCSADTSTRHNFIFSTPTSICIAAYVLSAKCMIGDNLVPLLISASCELLYEGMKVTWSCRLFSSSFNRCDAKPYNSMHDASRYFI